MIVQYTIISMKKKNTVIFRMDFQIRCLNSNCGLLFIHCKLNRYVIKANFAIPAFVISEAKFQSIWCHKSHNRNQLSMAAQFHKCHRSWNVLRHNYGAIFVFLYHFCSKIGIVKIQSKNVHLSFLTMFSAHKF